MSLTPEARLEILNYYGCDSLEEILDDPDVDLYDSVQEGFCTECGAYYGEVEPDATGYSCNNEDCGKEKVKALTMILMLL